MEPRVDKLKEHAKLEKLAAVHEHLLPRVIDLDMIYKHVYQQGPTGEAGRVAREEGINLDDVKELRLEYLKILKMDHFWVLPNLTKLQLNNNSIGSIDNIHMLIHLKELDLSFNCIWTIENLDKNVNLEILNLYQNNIKRLENMDHLKKLTIFSIGQNQIEDRDVAILYLRNFRNLKSLSLKGNPMCDTENFTEFVIAFLFNLVYYEYAMILPSQRQEAIQLFSREVGRLEEGDEILRAKLEREEKETAEAEQHSVSFVERLNGDQLFRQMFERDEEGQYLANLNDETTELFDTFHDDFTAVCKDLFAMGQEQYQLRKTEYDDFLNCVGEAKGRILAHSQETVKDFLSKFKIITTELDQSLKTLEDDNTEVTRPEKLESTAAVFRKDMDEFTNLIHNTWQTLMKAEISLYEETEDVNTTFEREMSDMVNVMLERALGYFVELRSLQESYNEQISEICNRYIVSVLNPSLEGGPKVPEQLQEVMSDKEVLSNSLANSHDIHMVTIDAREDTLTTRIKAWHEEVCESLQRKEIARDRETIVEINQFLDFHRDMFDDLLASRPDDLAVFMEDQLEAARKENLEEILKPVEDGSQVSPSRPSLFSVQAKSQSQSVESAITKIPSVVLEKKTTSDGSQRPPGEAGRKESSDSADKQTPLADAEERVSSGEIEKKGSPAENEAEHQDD